MIWKKQTSLELVFDFPIGLFTEKELIEALDLPLVQEKYCASNKCIYK